MDEEVILKDRILTEERQIKHLLSKFMAFTHYKNNTEALNDQLNGKLQGLWADLELSVCTFVQFLRDTVVASEAFQKQLESLSGRKKEYQNLIEECSLQIERLQNDLVAARQERARKIEYDRIAKVIMEIPSCQKTEKKIDAAKALIQRLEKVIRVDGAALESELKERNFRLIDQMLQVQREQAKLRADSADLLNPAVVDDAEDSESVVEMTID